MCARLEEERRTSEELRGGLEKEREELRTKLRDATNEVRGHITLVECVFLPDKRISDTDITQSLCALRSVGWSQRSNSKTRKRKWALKPHPHADRSALVWRKSFTRLAVDWLGYRRRQRGSGTGSRERSCP